MEQEIDWEKIARALEKGSPSGEKLNKKELQTYLDSQTLWTESQAINKGGFTEISDEQIQVGKAKIWQRIQQEQLTDNLEADFPISQHKTRKIWPGVVTAAASLLLLLSVWLFTDSRLQHDKPFVANQSGTYRLPDHSKVELQEGSLSYEYNPKTLERKVKLEGAAYFSVAKNAESPFVIYSEKGKVKVIGTAFQLNVQKSANEILLVDEGVVAFYPKTTAEFPIFLRKNERLLTHHSSNEWKRQNSQTESTFTWSQNKLSFDATLGEVAELVSDYTGKNIDFTNPELKKIHVGSAGQGMEFNNAAVVLQNAILPLSNQISITQHDKGWTIKRN